MTEIVNKIKESGLIQFDMAELNVTQEILEIDISEQLWQGLVLKEKNFRSWIKENDWSIYSGKAVRIFCSIDAIIPSWAYMLISSMLISNNSECIVGSKEDLQKHLISNNIKSLDEKRFKDGRVIVKGCSTILFPEYTTSLFMNKIQPLAKSIMFGEPCSTVPVFKRRS